MWNKFLLLTIGQNATREIITMAESWGCDRDVKKFLFSLSEIIDRRHILQVHNAWGEENWKLAERGKVFEIIER